MSFLSPVTRRVLAALSPDRQRELAIWSRNHAGLFSVRLHSMKTCPYLAYFPTYVFMRRNTPRWATWLYKFYRRKHREEGHCKCVAELAGAKP